MDYQRRFGGIVRLYGKNALEYFSRAHVCVIGIGGVGSWLVEALARSGIGQITLIDLDHVAESNINRQLPALESTLGKAKALVMKERVNEINPDAKVWIIDDFITIENMSQLLSEQYQFIVDCIDSYRIKAHLIAFCKEQRIPLLVMGGAGGRTDPLRIRVSDLRDTEQDPLLAKTRRQLRQHYGYSRNVKQKMHVDAVWSGEPLVRQPVDADCAISSGLQCGGLGSCMTVTAGFALNGAAFVLQKLKSGGRD